MADFEFDAPNKRGRGSGKFSRRSNDRNSPKTFNKRSSNRFERSAPVERTRVICDSCGKECEVPFKPSSNKPIYCDDCFKKNSTQKPSSSNRDLKEINEKLDKILKALKIED